MKLSLFVLPLFFVLQTGSCDDDSSDTEVPVNDNYIEFLGARNVASGGCNQEAVSGTETICVYTGGYSAGGLGYTVSVSHLGLCRSATFNMRDNLDQVSNGLFILQITENGVGIENYFGSTGTINVTDTGTGSSISFNGTIISTTTGEEQTITGFMECPF